MLRLFIDQDFNHLILRGLRARVQDLDAVTAFDLKRSRKKDEQHLKWAMSEGRVIVTHDVNTFTATVNEFIKDGIITPGLIIVPQLMPVGRAIEDLEMIVVCMDSSELQSRIQYIPIK